jgi:hypothetical protein
MKKIKFSHTFLNRLRNAEHFDLMSYVDTTLAGTEMNPAGFLPARNIFHRCFAKEDRVYKRAARRRETAGIAATHERRRKSYMAVKYIIEAASYHTAPAVKDAADLLLRMMSNYKSVYAAPMNEATALYTNLLEDFSKPRHAAALTHILTAGEAIAQLEVDNEAFRALYYARAQGEEKDKEEGSMAEARRAVNRAFGTLAEAINALWQVNEMLEDEKDQELCRQLGKMITDINAYLHQHKETYARRNAGGREAKNEPGDPAEPAGTAGMGGPADDLPARQEQTRPPERAIAHREPAGSSLLLPRPLTQPQPERLRQVKKSITGILGKLRVQLKDGSRYREHGGIACLIFHIISHHHVVPDAGIAV